MRLLRKKEGQVVGNRRLTVKFWGTRGSVPVPGRSTLAFGGNTSCVEVTFERKPLILDAGTGIRLLGQNLSQGKIREPIRILIGHTHMDHIGGLPFFGPALAKKNRLEIYGPRGLKRSLDQLFPFSVLSAKRPVKEVRPGPLTLSPFRVDCLRVNHPGGALGFRIETPSGRRIVYISDHEPVASHRHDRWGASDRSILRWMRRPDLLIMDAQYLVEEYPSRRGWGHSPFSYTVRLALEGGVRHLVLYHHDPAHSDADLRRKLKLSRKIIRDLGQKMRCSLAREGTRIII